MKVDGPNGSLRLLRTRLGRIIRDIRRRIAGKADLEATFEWPLTKANQIRSQQQRQRGFKLYSFHAQEVECIGKGKGREGDAANVIPTAVGYNLRLVLAWLRLLLHLILCAILAALAPRPALESAC
jgi:hypothetical protein